jgi:hypothetical protein
LLIQVGLIFLKPTFENKPTFEKVLKVSQNQSFSIP